jgi:hypothetical protein
VRLNPDVPSELEHIINRALEKDRELRYQHASEMRSELQRLKRDTETGRTPAASAGAAAQDSGAQVAQTPSPASHPAPAVAASHSSKSAKAAELPVADRKLWKVLVPAAVVAVLALVAGGYRYFHHAPVLASSDTVVLADFSNTTGDPVFEDTLKTALGLSLRQSPFLSALSDSQVAKILQQMTRPPGTKLTPEVARELCQRAHSKAYIAGSIASLGSEYVLGLKAVNCQSGDTLAQEQVTAEAKEKMLDTLGQAAAKLRGELGESLATVRKFDVPLEQVTTSSLEALQAYSLGLKTEREKGATAALPYFQRAIELDPNFAVDYLALGSQYFNLEQPERAKEYFTKAFQLRERTSEREKLAISALYYRIVTGERDKSAQTFQQEIDITPSTKWVTCFSGPRIGHGVHESSSSPVGAEPV